LIGELNRLGTSQFQNSSFFKDINKDLPKMSEKVSQASQEKSIETFRKQIAIDNFVPIADGSKDDQRGEALGLLLRGLGESMEASH
jgi:hypothetical protein